MDELEQKLAKAISSVMGVSLEHGLKLVKEFNAVPENRTAMEHDRKKLMAMTEDEMEFYMIMIMIGIALDAK